MSDIKVKEAFSLPVKCVYDETGTPFQIEDSYGDLLIDGESTCDETNFEVVAHAINNHDRLTKENAQLKADNTELVDFIESELSNSVNVAFRPHIAGVFALIREKLIQKHKDSNDG